jgi:hypothetical protein
MQQPRLVERLAKQVLLVDFEGILAFGLLGHGADLRALWFRLGRLASPLEGEAYRGFGDRG